jgi:hypothetical protein
MRVFLQYILPLLLPSLLYILWVVLARRRTASSGGTVSVLQVGPWFWLILTGIGLAACGLIASALLFGGDPKGTYMPPHLENGRVVPGRVQ